MNYYSAASVCITGKNANMSKCLIDENEIARQVRQSLQEYFKNLDGEEPPVSVYDMVINCVEKPLIETVLQHAEGNQSRAAELLGINRNTLRKKIQQYGI
jgi:Fis family transcriptional regulator